MVNEPWLRARSEFAFVSGYLSILEAMARKKLVFAVYQNELKKDYLTMIPGAEGMMEISSSPESLAKAIEERIDDRDGRREMVDRAYDFSRQSTWKKVAEQYLRLWGVSRG
jgi:glycosyltransferase involved in cell wall biosynthesis